MRGRSGAREWLASPQQEECSLCFVVSASGVRQLGTQGEGFKKQGGGESQGNIHHRPPTNPNSSRLHIPPPRERRKGQKGRRENKSRDCGVLLRGLRGSAESEREGAAHEQMPPKGPAIQQSSPVQKPKAQTQTRRATASPVGCSPFSTRRGGGRGVRGAEEGGERAVRPSRGDRQRGDLSGSRVAAGRAPWTRRKLCSQMPKRGGEAEEGRGTRRQRARAAQQLPSPQSARNIHPQKIMVPNSAAPKKNISHLSLQKKTTLHPIANRRRRATNDKRRQFDAAGGRALLQSDGGRRGEEKARRGAKARRARARARARRAGAKRVPARQKAVQPGKNAVQAQPRRRRAAQTEILPIARRREEARREAEAWRSRGGARGRRPSKQSRGGCRRKARRRAARGRSLPEEEERVRGRRRGAARGGAAHTRDAGARCCCAAAAARP